MASRDTTNQELADALVAEVNVKAASKVIKYATNLKSTDTTS
jgi:hypothetical protein